ncbi:MAG: regulatory protein [Kangiellaceae bacterium]|jgi:regulatory protein
MSEDQAKIINHNITRLLSRREHSQFELIQKLALKGFDQKLCVQQLQFFIDKRIQSDERYLEAYVRSAFLKGKGPQVIRQTLSQHNIDGTHVKQYIYDDDYNWYNLAVEVRAKRFGQELPIDFTDKQKQMRFLEYRGFEQEQINAAFN